MERTYGDLQDKNRIISEQKVIIIMPWCVEIIIVNCSVIYLFHASGSCEDCQHYVEASLSVYFKISELVLPFFNSLA